ncbi:MAG: FMN-binding protein [Nitrospirota bacterium]
MIEDSESQIKFKCWWSRVLLFASILTLIFGLATEVSAQVFLKPQEAIEKLMPEAETHVTDSKEPTPELKKRLEEALGRRAEENKYLFIIGMKQGKPTAYAVILNEIGKERPITFMIVINPDGRVRVVEVLVYRESQGSEIRDRRFMRQFEGKTIMSELRAGRDIDAITGATLSSRSATYAVKKALALVDLIYEIRAQ